MTKALDSDTDDCGSCISGQILEFAGREHAFVEHRGRRMAPILEPQLLTPDELLQVRQYGKRIRDYELFFHALYVQHYLAQNQPLVPPFYYVESALSPDLVKYQREIAAKRPLSPFRRTDEPRPGFVIEVQKRIGGQGIFMAYFRAFETYLRGPHYPHLKAISPVDGLAVAVQHIATTIPTDGVIVIIAEPIYVPEQATFARYINEISALETVVIATSELDRIDGCYLDVQGLRATEDGIQRHFGGSGSHRVPIRLICRRGSTLETFSTLNNWPQLYTAYLDGMVGILPELNVIEDSKLPIASISMPTIYEQMPPELRGVFPKSALIPAALDQPFGFGDDVLTLNEVVAMSNRHRLFVLKYAGHALRYGFGGRGVFRLFRASHREAQAYLDFATGEVRKGHPWMLQEVDLTRYAATFVSHEAGTLRHSPNMHARLMMFYLDRSNETELVGAALNLRNHWKTSGADDSLIAPLYTSPYAEVEYVADDNFYQRRIVRLNGQES